MRRNWKRLIIIRISFMLFIIITFLVTYVFIGYIDKNNKVAMEEQITIERRQYEQGLKKRELEEEKRETEKQSFSTYSLYDKLDSKYKVNFLILGESLLQDGVPLDISPFEYSIEDKTKEMFDSFCETDFLNLYDASMLWGWQHYNQNPNNYDLAIITINFEDNYYLDQETFGLFTEVLTRSLIRESEDIEIIYIIDYETHWDKTLYEGMYHQLYEIADFYKGEIIDMNQVLTQKDEEDIFLEDSELSLVGYQHYADAILKVIDKNIKIRNNPRENHTLSYYEEAQLLDTCYKVSPIENSGFKELGITFIGEKTGDFLLFEDVGQYGLLTYITDYEGGKFQVYIDDIFYGEFDTKQEEFEMKTILLSKELKKDSQIRIVISDINELEIRHSVHIVGLVTN